MVTDSGVTTTTAYTGGTVYENGSLKFINHAEGYIEPEGAGGYDYIYQHKDIWGNTRITYADADDDGSINTSEIRREQNYYPFGLEHRGYNSSITGVKNNLKTYQGQEFTDDLNLNIHEWKYRISDPTIGRFWQIDPLAEDYTYNSTYAFQENKMGMGVELEGLELAEWYRGGTEDPNYKSSPGAELTVIAFVGIVAAAAVGLEVAGAYIVEEITEAVVEEATGVPIITDPVDIVEQGVKKTIKEGAETVTKKTNKTIKEQASDIKKNLNDGKNSVTVKTTDGKVHYDLDGATHKGVETLTCKDLLRIQILMEKLFIIKIEKM